MVNTIDAIIVIFLLLGALYGFKRGVIKSSVSFFFFLLVIILAFSLKNPLSEFMYLHFPFFNFTGELAGISVFNILIYEGIAFLIIFGILEVLLKLVIFASGILEKILRLTIVFGAFSKFLGLIFGFIEYYLITFVVLFILANLSFSAPYIEESNLASKILLGTPVLGEVIHDEANAIKEILDLQEVYDDNKEECNKEAFAILIKYNILSVDSAEELINSGKLKIAGAEEIISEYRK